jgi:hypothetical protein
VKKPHARPPCPGTVAGAPGKAKTDQADRPCKGHPKKHNGSNGGSAKGGFVLVFMLPPLAGAALRIGRRRVLRPLRRRLRAR